MSNYPANNNIETPEGFQVPSAPQLNEPVEVYTVPIQSVYAEPEIEQPPQAFVDYQPTVPPTLVIKQFQPEYVHNPRLYALPKQNFFYIPREQPKKNKNNGFFGSLAAYLCCLFCCCPIPC